EQRFLGVKAVLGLFPDHALRAVDHLGGDLLAAMRRQAVHEERFALSGLHHLGVDLPVLKSRLRASFSDSNPIEVHTSVVTRSAPRAASIGSGNTFVLRLRRSFSTSYPGGVEI